MSINYLDHNKLTHVYSKVVLISAVPLLFIVKRFR